MQVAKALNAGLQYGMSPETLWGLGYTEYGLRWKHVDAVAASAGWYEDYPNINFLQRWVAAVSIVPHDQAVMMLRHERNVYKSLVARPTRLRCSWTLRGRPIVVAEQREAVRFANHGTIADALYEAIVRDYSRFHDSLISITGTGLMYEIDEKDIELLKREITHAMAESVNSHMGKHGISASVTAEVIAK
jgi:hypothetical protein